MAIGLTVAGLATAAVLGIVSDGFYHDDDVTHYLFARSAWHSANDALHVWGRPGYTLPTAVVAHWFGMAGCRLFSAVQTAVVAYLAFGIARILFAQNPRLIRLAWLAPLFVWVQPLVMTLSETTLTEVPAGLYLTAFVYLYLRRRRVWACIAMSPLFVTRYETMGLMPIVAAAVILDVLSESDWRIVAAIRKWWPWACAAALLWAPLAYVLAAIGWDLPRGISPLYMFSRTYTDQYGAGGWSHFVICWIVACGIGTASLTLAGVALAGRKGWLVSAFVVGLVGLHTLIYRMGAFESGGYARFLVPAAGPAAALAALGLSGCLTGRRVAVTACLAVLGGGAAVGFLYTGLSAGIVLTLLVLAMIVAMGARSQRVRSALGSLAVVLAVGVGLGQAMMQIRPLTLRASAMHSTILSCLEKASSLGCDADPALTSHVLIKHLRPNTKLAYNVDDAARAWREASAGTLYLWDSKYAGGAVDEGRGLLLEDVLKQFGREVCRVENGFAKAAVFVRTNRSAAE